MEREPMEAEHEVCCFVHKGNKLPILGNYPTDEEIEINGTYRISVFKKHYDRIRGLTQRIEPRILNSDRKVNENNGIISYQVSGREYVHLMSLGERSTKKTKKISSKPTANIKKTHRARISEAAKNLWKAWGGKRETALRVPRGYRSVKI